MLPVIFSWANGAVYSYIFLFSIGFLIGAFYWIANFKKKFPQISTDSLINASILILLLGLLGARIFFVLTNLEHYKSGVFEMTKLSSGGVVFYGGMLGGLFGLWLWSKKNNLSTLLALNIMVPGLALGHAIGRLGCFAHGCCHGRLCSMPWGIAFDNPESVARPLNVPLHPTQLYEVFGLLAIAYLCHRQNHSNFKKRISALQVYLMGYGLLRFFIEFFRGDSLRGELWALSTSQWVSIAMIFSSVFLDFKSSNDHNSPHENRT